MDELFGALCVGTPAHAASPATVLADVETLAREMNLVIQRDDDALATWISQAIAANPKAAEDVRAGKVQAAGRLVGEVMKLPGGTADAKSVRETLLKALGQG